MARRAAGVLTVMALALPLTAGAAVAVPCLDCTEEPRVPESSPGSPGGSGGGGGGGSGGGGGGGAAAAAPVTVTGTFTYTDLDTKGALFQRPIAHARVEVWRFAPREFGIWRWAADRTVSTDAAGSLSTTFPYDVPGVRYALRVHATNYAAVVWPNDAVHTVPFHVEPGQPAGAPIQRTATAPGQVLSFDWAFTDSWTPQHFNLAETVRRGFDFAAARRDPREVDPLPQADVQPTSVSGSWYNPVVDTVVINSGGVTADGLILHEYAHFLEEQISSFPWIASSHDGCTARDGLGAVINSAEHAWMEGFANWFAQAVRRDAVGAALVGDGGGGGGTLPAALLEAPACAALPAGVRGEQVELFVAGALFDLGDAPGDPGSRVEAADTLARRDTEVLQIVDRELDVPPHGGPWPTVLGFRQAWRDRGLPAAALDDVLALNGIPVPATPTAVTALPPGSVTVQPPPAEPSPLVCARKPWTPGC